MEKARSEARNPGLDAVRSAAIWMVLLSHLTFFLPRQTVQESGLWRLEIFGYYGVELFFVLSGFLIGRILLETFAVSGSAATLAARLWTFYRRRWYRTLPSYYLILLVNTLYWQAVQLPQFPATLQPDWRHLVFLQNYDMLASGFFPESWSLAVEEWFYLLTPLWLLLWRQLLPQRWRAAYVLGAALAALALAVAAARCGYVLAYEPIFDYGVRKSSFLRLDSLAVGVGAAWLWLYAPAWHQSLAGKRPALVALVVLGGVALHFWQVGWEGWDRSFWARTLLLDAVSLAFAVLMNVCYYRLRRSHSVFWGTSQLAYALYLVHLPIFATLGAWGAGSTVAASAGLALLAGTAAYGAAWLLYRFWEQPWLQRRPAAPK
ncbi:MAG: acyltransferase [Anaeromusa sp.]|uniref:acyltransferase family protein n=1 Tax=Anaeromusa sp. TaxID=1872520 RepID=UPI002B20D95F|nr:acyltransferase [Anaeromusa sp.]MEA4836634.1 acyltransferase [Anaeromusa sp.]